MSIDHPTPKYLIDKGLPLILYDDRYPAQSSNLIGYAAMCGYNVHIFAPGFPESDVCNPLDFLRNESDAATARQLAVLMGRNFKPINQSNRDPFFDNAAEQLVEAVLMLTKTTRFPDLMMCQSILGLSKLPERLEAVKMNPWIRFSFGQLISVKDSEKTVGSIIGVANSMFAGFLKPSLIPAFWGPSTLPLDFKDKQLMVMGVDRARREVVAPLVALVLDWLVGQNTSKQYSAPLVISLEQKNSISQQDFDIPTDSEGVWKQIRTQLIGSSSQSPIAAEALTIRDQIASELFPLPEQELPTTLPIDPRRFDNLL